SVVHMSDGFDFLGFHIQWRRKRGTNKWYVYTFIAQRPIRSLKAKVRALTRRTSQQDLRYVLTRLNQVMHGWASYFRHAIATHAEARLDQGDMLVRFREWPGETGQGQRGQRPTGRLKLRGACMPVGAGSWRTTGPC